MRHPREFAPPWEAPIEFRSRGRWWLLVAGSLLICVASWVLTHDTTPGAGLSLRSWLTLALAALVVILLNSYRAGGPRPFAASPTPTSSSSGCGTRPRARPTPTGSRPRRPPGHGGGDRHAGHPHPHSGAGARSRATPASLPPHALDLEVPPLMWSSLPSNLRTVLGTALVLGI